MNARVNTSWKTSPKLLLVPVFSSLMQVKTELINMIMINRYIWIKVLKVEYPVSSVRFLDTLLVSPLLVASHCIAMFVSICLLKRAVLIVSMTGLGLLAKGLLIYSKVEAGDTVMVWRVAIDL